MARVDKGGRRAANLYFYILNGNRKQTLTGTNFSGFIETAAFMKMFPHTIDFLLPNINVYASNVGITFYILLGECEISFIGNANIYTFPVGI